MIRFFCPHRTRVLKARPRRKAGATYKRLSKLTSAMSSSVGLDLFRGFKKFKSHVEPERVYQAWSTGHYAKIMEAIPWEKLPHYLEPAATKLSHGMIKSANMTIDSLPDNANKGLRFNMKNPRMREYVGRRTGEMVINIQTDAQKVIQNAVARSFNEALTPRDVAATIRGSIGLYPQQETALRNYRQNLIQNETKPERIEGLVGAYEDRLLDQRSMMIARTETRLATNVGQQAVWEQASDEGLLPTEVTRVWVVDGNPCDICEPMDGEEVGLNEPWIMEDGDAVMLPTEAHPNCMCGMELNIG